MSEAANDSAKLIAQALDHLKKCNVEWEDEDVATSISILEQALDKLLTEK